MIGAVLQEFLFAGTIDGVVKGGSCTIVQLVNSHGDRLHIVGEVLGQLDVAVESDNERLIKPGANRVLQETVGRVLFEIETAVARAAHVNQQPEFKGQIRLAAKIDDGLRRLVVVEYGEVGLVQAADKLAALVGVEEQNVAFIHPLAAAD